MPLSGTKPSRLSRLRSSAKLSGEAFTKNIFFVSTLGSYTSSVTRFSEISPSEQHFKSLRQLLRVYLFFGKMLNSIWTFSMLLGAFSLRQMGKYGKNTDIWSHCTLGSLAF